MRRARKIQNDAQGKKSGTKRVENQTITMATGAAKKKGRSGETGKEERQKQRLRKNDRWQKGKGESRKEEGTGKEVAHP